MFSSFFQEIKPVQRNFSPPYLLVKEYQNHFEKEGYVVIRNVIHESEINDVLQTYEHFKENKEFDVGNKFESSGNFRSIDLQTKIFDYIESFMSKTVERYANLANCEIGRGGAFFIKPNTDTSRLEPHQDSTVIDEANSYGLFVWIPLVDIDETNGALYVLPKSHLWGNHYRSQHIPWAFRKCHKELWNHMLPIYVKRGDIILFDTSIIHASELNKSSKFRIVLCGALLPKNHQKVDYKKERRKVIQYAIDDNYWLDGGLETSLSKYKSLEIQNNFPEKVSNRMIRKIVNKQ